VGHDPEPDPALEEGRAPRARSGGTQDLPGGRIGPAAERGWKVPDETRAAALGRVAALLEAPDLTPRDLMAILRALVACDRTDILEEKLALDRAKWAAGRPHETVETAADLARQLLDAARGHEEAGPPDRAPRVDPGSDL